jgi:ATP-binding cassette, subfamily B, multidrug efflux pump
MAGKSTGKIIFDLSLLRRVFQYAKPYKKKFIFSVIMAILLAVISPIRPWLIQITINDYVHQGVVGDKAKKISMEEVIIWVTVIQIGLLLLETAFRFYFSYLTAWLG